MSMFEIRRSSFLSDAMIQEDHTCSMAGIAEDGTRRYSIIVRRAQGFEWNPQIFRYRSNSSDSDYDDARPQVYDIVFDSDVEEEGDDDGDDENNNNSDEAHC